MRQQLTRFFYGRYGTDQLSVFLILFYFVFRSLSMFLDFSIFVLIPISALIFAYYRIFSKNIGARQQENQKYLAITAPYWDKFNFFLLSVKDKRHRYFRCPHCKLRLRAPVGKGTIEITCSSCREKFKEKT